MPAMGVDPAASLLRLQESLDRLRRTAAGASTFGPSRPGVFPPLNVFTEEEALVVRAEVPGFKGDEFDVNVERRRLTISGERAQGADEEQPGSYHRRERQAGKFSRSLQLPDNLEPDGATAECRNGILTVRIPKRPEYQPRKVAITQG